MFETIYEKILYEINIISKGCDSMELPILHNDAEEWSRAFMLYDAALKQINTKLEILNNEFKLAHQYNPIEHITSRLKTPQSIAKKLLRQGRELTVENVIDHINDVAGIRIICSFTSDIYRIADLLSTQNDIQVLKVKDYIANPKPNGYTSYHMIVSTPIFLSENTIDTKVEIQIRTIAMDFWASLEHKIYYKFEGKAPDYIQRELKECSELVSYLDHKMLSINEKIKDLNSGQDATITAKIRASTINKDSDIYTSINTETEAEAIVDESVDRNPDKEDKKKDKWSNRKSGKNRMFFGFGAH